MNTRDRGLLTSSHWGTFHVETDGSRVTALRDFGPDPDPSPIGQGMIGVQDDSLRITAPMVRQGWLENGPTRGKSGGARGAEPFVEVTWEEVNRLVAGEMTRIRRDHGNSAIFAGSYGWASAGRFHHAQSQLKRFLNTQGGFTRSLNTYSFAAAEVIVPHVLGTYRGHLDTCTGWDSIAEGCDLFVAFGGVPLKNGQISQGGTGAHIQKGGLLAARAAGVDFVNISPLRSDLIAEAEAQWLPIRPGADVALILALCHTLLTERRHDPAFLDRYTVGFGEFAAYLTGAADGQAKDADWAAPLCEIEAETIRALARRMAASRTMISVAWALTRAEHGEQPFWAGIALAAMLGGIGLPGQGIGFGYSAVNPIGNSLRHIDYAAVPQGENPVKGFIPVARIADMLENPGAPFDYDGQSLTYPDIRMIWWAGGNPFHHHQDLNRLARAWQRPETVIVNDWCWNSLARHADIVLPCTTTLERADIAMTPKDPWLVAMDRATAPVGQARDDYDIFAGIAAELGGAAAFTEGRSAEDWQRWLWDISRQQAARAGVDLPDWAGFQAAGHIRIPAPEKPTVMMEAFRADPAANPLATPSGKIEIFSKVVADFGYDDCPGHPAWLPPREGLGPAAPDELHMLSNQPRTKLHSQLDHGTVSRADRPQGREPLTMHPADAAARGLEAGQIVRVHNARGACLAELRLSPEIRRGVVQLATGAWWDPDADGLCRHGNPNALTPDRGTSRLAQGPTAHSCLVRVAGFDGPLPEVGVLHPPEVIRR